MFSSNLGNSNDLDEEFLNRFDYSNKNESKSINCLLGKCIRCSVGLFQSYQLIFNKIGKDLELQKLLSICFDIDVKEKKQEIQAVCHECLRELIETYDLMQKESSDKEIKREILDHENNKNTMNNNNIKLNSVPFQEFTLNNTKMNTNQHKSEKFEDCKTAEANANKDKSNDECNKFENEFYLDYFDEEIDLEAYKRKVIKNHKFDDIKFTEYIQCRICSESLSDHVKLIEHTIQSHHDSTKMYPCIVDENCAQLNTLENLTYHMAFKHYNLKNLIILAECPECNQFFNNFMSYNKHCCDKTRDQNRSILKCAQCKKYFKSNKRYRFHLQFHLQKRRPKACMICDLMFQDEDEFYEHIQYEHEDNIDNICKDCDLIFSCKQNLKNHIESSHSGLNKYKCSVCSEYFSSLLYLRQHSICHEKALYHCNICGKSLSRKSRLKRHLLCHKEPIKSELMYCIECGLIANTVDEVTSHLNKHNPNDEIYFQCELMSIVYVCENCNLVFNTIDNLLNHRKKHLPNEFVCNLCNITHNKYSTMSSHRLSHSNKDMTTDLTVLQQFVCGIEDCRKTYKIWTSLNLHRQAQHKIRDNINCTKCTSKFNTYFDYKNHLLKSHNGITFDCQFCYKSFRNKSSLTFHLKSTHNRSIESNTKLEKRNKSRTDIKNELNPKYQCKFCKKLFSSRRDVSFHEKAFHNKEPRFFCSICLFKTPYKQTLTYHMRTHNNEYLYECYVCNKKFRFKNSYKLHVQRHNDVREFVCEINGCGMSYINLGRLKTHMKLKHSPNVKNVIKKNYTNFTTKISNVFIDDDDGLEEGIIDEPYEQQQPIQNVFKIKQNKIENVEEEENDNKIYVMKNDVEFVKEEEKIQYSYYDNNKKDIVPVLIIRNNDYVMQLDHTKIYGNALEVTDIGATEVVGE